PAGAGRLSMRLLLIRHAESQGNFERRLQGRREFPLTERGLAQAQALAERLVSLPLSAVYSSPVGRAIQTAEVLAAEACLDVLGREYQRPIPFVLDNASITTVEVNNGARSHVPPMIVTGINDACHVNHIQSDDRAGGT